MKLVAAFAFTASSVIGLGVAQAADEFEVLPDVYGSCIAVNKSADGNVRNDCLSNASIYNKADGSIYSCEAHLAVNVEGLQLTSTVAYKKASCTLANPPAAKGAGPSSVALKGDFPQRRSPAGGAAAIVPARFFWRTRRDKLTVDVCFDFVGYKAYSGCIDARLKQEAPVREDTAAKPEAAKPEAAKPEAAKPNAASAKPTTPAPKP